MKSFAGALNLTPIVEVLALIVAICLGIAVVCAVGFFLLVVIWSAANFLLGDGDDEFGAIIVFWGGLAIIVALIVLLFTEHIVAFE